MLRDVCFSLKKLDLILTSGSEDVINLCLEDLYELGKAENAFAGMVRIMYKHNTGEDWSDLAEAFEEE